MFVALVPIKTRFEIFACVILVQCLSFNYYADAQKETTTDKYADSRVARKSCLLKPDAGPCRGNVLMHYFDPKRGVCKRFVWGGCQGNGNRFDSREECYSSCLRDTDGFANSRPRFCNLTFDYGYCFGDVKRYYYDHLWKVCKERIYSGCGGNKNNFYSIEECNSICNYGNGLFNSIVLKKGQRKKVIIIDSKTATTKSLVQTRKTVAAAITIAEDGT